MEFDVRGEKCEATGSSDLPRWRLREFRLCRCLSDVTPCRLGSTGVGGCPERTEWPGGGSEGQSPRRRRGLGLWTPRRVRSRRDRAPDTWSPSLPSSPNLPSSELVLPLRRRAPSTIRRKDAETRRCLDVTFCGSKVTGPEVRAQDEALEPIQYVEEPGVKGRDR